MRFKLLKPKWKQINDEWAYMPVDISKTRVHGVAFSKARDVRLIIEEKKSTLKSCTCFTKEFAKLFK